MGRERPSPDTATASGSPAAVPKSAAGPDPALVAGWVEAARGGDGTAFAALVKAYGGLVTRVIGRLVSDPDDRDDLVQETFVRAWSGLGKFRTGEDFRPWIATIAVNLARDAWRRRKGRPVALPLTGDGGEPAPSREPSPEGVAAGEELRLRVESAFRRLDAEAQTILWLRVREGLAYSEIAAVLGVPRGTVMSRLSRARAALRAELERRGGIDIP